MSFEEKIKIIIKDNQALEVYIENNKVCGIRIKIVHHVFIFAHIHTIEFIKDMMNRQLKHYNKFGYNFELL